MPDTLRPEPLTFCTDHHCKGRSPGHGPMSFPCPPLPDLNSSHTHCRVNTQAGACGCHEGPSREQSTVTYSPSRVCAFKSHLYSFSHVSVTSSYVWPQFPFLSLYLLFFLSSFLTLPQNPESYSPVRMCLLNRRPKGKTGRGSVWNSLVNH